MDKTAKGNDELKALPRRDILKSDNTDIRLAIDDLKILDFEQYDVLNWLAELIKHRDAADSKRYHMLANKVTKVFSTLF